MCARAQPSAQAPALGPRDDNERTPAGASLEAPPPSLLLPLPVSLLYTPSFVLKVLARLICCAPHAPTHAAPPWRSERGEPRLRDRYV